MMLTARRHNQDVVARCCGVSAGAGVRVGMSVAAARALLGDCPLMVRSHEGAREEAALAALARWALRFTPIVSADPPDGLVMDVSGCQRIFGCDEKLLDRIAAEIGRLGFGVRVAMGPTVGATWAVARFGAEQAIVRPEQIKDVLGELPVAGLRLDRETVAGLQEVAIDRIAELAVLPRASLAERFGLEVVRRLDQALGRVVEVIEPVRPIEPPSVERPFPGPVKQVEAVHLAVRRLLEDLARELLKRDSGARAIVLHLERLDDEPATCRLTVSRPTADAAHLWKLLQPHLERTDIGEGVESMRLIATSIDRLPHGQGRCWDDEERSVNESMDESMGRWLDVVIARLGAERVVRLEPIETHVPESAFVRWPATEDRSRRAAEARVVEADRPTRLLSRPEPIEVVILTPDGPVVSMTRRGRVQRIVATVGPERIAGRWWLMDHVHFDPPQRDYFKVQDEAGGWWWLFRLVQSGRWFMHGQWA